MIGEHEGVLREGERAVAEDELEVPVDGGRLAEPEHVVGEDARVDPEGGDARTEGGGSRAGRLIVPRRRDVSIAEGVLRIVPTRTSSRWTTSRYGRTLTRRGRTSCP